MGQARLPVEKIALSAPVAVKPALAYFLPVKVEIDDWGRAWANPAPTNGSGDFTVPGRNGWLRRAAPRTEHLRQRICHAPVPVVRTLGPCPVLFLRLLR